MVFSVPVLNDAPVCYIDIKAALYFIVICVVVLEILGKMACFIDSK